MIDMSGTGRNITKTRNWAFVLYPESAPENWLDMLTDEHMPILVSPLHDKDRAKDGNIKKAHYHIVIMSDGPISQKRANEIIEPYYGTQSAEYVKSLKGYARYLAHLDDPEKFQYDPSEIIALGGADLNELLKPSRSDKYQYIGEMIDYCDDNNVFEFSDLLKYARKERQNDWFPVLVDSAYLMSRYLTSLRFAEESRLRKGVALTRPRRFHHR
jgi:hypothetical protein